MSVVFVSDGLKADNYPVAACEIDEGKYYNASKLGGIIMDRGRRLDEALRNDPLAPPPALDAKGRPGKFFLGADLIEYMNGVLSRDKFGHEEISKIQEWHSVRVADAESRVNKKLLELDAQFEEHKRQLFKNEIMDRVFNALEAASRVSAEEALCCGVYFLYKGSDLQYVGQSVNVISRVAEHRKTKDFDEFRFIRCEQEHLNELEGFFINLLRPPLNGCYTGSRSQKMHAPASMLIEMLSLRCIDADKLDIGAIQ